LSHLVLQFLLQSRHIVLGQRQRLARTLHIAANLFRRSGRIFEIPSHCNLSLLAAVQQPEHNEQRHHGGHEIRIGDFSRASMVAAVAATFLDHDDWFCVRPREPA